MCVFLPKTMAGLNETATWAPADTDHVSERTKGGAAVKGAGAAAATIPIMGRDGGGGGAASTAATSATTQAMKTWALCGHIVPSLPSQLTTLVSVFPPPRKASS